MSRHRTTRSGTGATGKGGVISVNYDGFIDDVSVGDELLVDGGIISFVVRRKTDTDVQVSHASCGTCVMSVQQGAGELWL